MVTNTSVLAIVASGTTNGFWRQTQVEGLATVEAQIADVARQVEHAASIAVIGATGVSSAANLAHRYPAKTIELHFSQDEPPPGYQPRVRRALARGLLTRGLRLHPGHGAAVPDGRIRSGPSIRRRHAPPTESALRSLVQMRWVHQ